MRRRIWQKLLLLFISFVFVFSVLPMTSLAAPSGSAVPNCWESGGQLEIQLSGCSGYASITVVVEFSGTVSSATGWGFDSYDISGNRVTAVCSSSGPNSWGFDNKVGIQVTGSGINSAKLISVSGDGEAGSVDEPAVSETTSNEAPRETARQDSRPARNTESSEALTTFSAISQLCDFSPLI